MRKWSGMHLYGNESSWCCSIHTPVRRPVLVVLFYLEQLEQRHDSVVHRRLGQQSTRVPQARGLSGWTKSECQGWTLIVTCLARDAELDSVRFGLGPNLMVIPQEIEKVRDRVQLKVPRPHPAPAA